MKRQKYKNGASLKTQQEFLFNIKVIIFEFLLILDMDKKAEMIIAGAGA